MVRLSRLKTTNGHLLFSKLIRSEQYSLTKDLRAATTRRNAVIRPTVDGGRVGDDASDRVVMVSWWLLARKVSVVDPSNFVGPTTRSPARLASPFPFLSLCLSL